MFLNSGYMTVFIGKLLLVQMGRCRLQTIPSWTVHAAAVVTFAALLSEGEGIVVLGLMLCVCVHQEATACVLH